MGWYYTYGASRKSLSDEILREFNWETPTGKSENLRHCFRGNVLWTLNRTVKRASGTETVWIGCHLLSRGTGDGWGYKPMDESMGPFYYTCPKSYLDASTCNDSSAPKWRADCLEVQTQRLARLRARRLRRAGAPV